MILHPCKHKIMCPFRTEPKPRPVVWAYYGIFLCMLVWCFGQGKSRLNDIGSSHETRLLSASNCNELSPMIYKQDHHNIKLLKQVVITASVIHAKVTKYVATFRYIRVQNGDCMMPTSTVYAIKYAYDFFVLCCHHTMCYKWKSFEVVFLALSSMMTLSNGTFSALLPLCEGTPSVIDGFLSKRQVTLNFDVVFDLRLNKRLSKQSGCWWFDTSSRSLWRHCNEGPEPRRTWM